jgi:hypothetical protein
MGDASASSHIRILISGYVRISEALFLNRCDPSLRVHVSFQDVSLEQTAVVGMSFGELTKECLWLTFGVISWLYIGTYTLTGIFNALPYS